MVLSCILCDMQAEGRFKDEFYFASHDRDLWVERGKRVWLANVHALMLAEGGDIDDGPWVQKPMHPTFIPCPTPLDDPDWVGWIPEDEPEE